MLETPLDPTAQHPGRRGIVRRWGGRILGLVLLIAVSLVVGGGLQAVLNLPDLQPWHRLVPQAEPDAADLNDDFTLAQYLAREAEVFKQVRDEVETPVSASTSAQLANRYQSASISSPRRLGRDWNQTFEVRPPGAVRGGALLIHGLTDSPYSMRTVADALSARGYYVLALRMPGHGTVPGGLTRATAEDWMAAVRMGARHVHKTVGAGQPMVLVGYSNGGALVVRYALAAAADSRLPAPSSLVLISPMIGVSPLARMARVISALGPLPFFEKARWLELVTGIQPVQIQLVSRQRGEPELPRLVAGTERSCRGRAERRDRSAAADPGVSIDCRRHGQHRGSGARSVRPAARQWA